MALSACAQEVKFVSMLLEETNEVQKPLVIYEDNQGVIFIAKNRQVDMYTNQIDICHNLLREMMEDKDIDLQYIWSEDKPADIITGNTLESDFVKHIKRITEV